jgi:hypothetical protein
VYRYVFKLLIGILLLAACSDIPRDNILDPGNPNSFQSSTILIEAFVNTNNPFSFNQWALQALDSVKLLYGVKILIAEYHRNTSQYLDPYSNTDIFEPLYEKYVENSSSNLKGVPDIFINGTTHRVQGASSVSSVITRLNSIISELVILNNHFTLEPGAIKVNGDELIASCKIARLGSQSAEDLLLKMILVQRVNLQELKRVAVDLKKSNVISRLAAGDIITINFDPVPISQTSEKVIFSLTSSDELIVYQNIEVNL